MLLFIHNMINTLGLYHALVKQKKNIVASTKLEILLYLMAYCLLS
jgi:hypothetical protein